MTPEAAELYLALLKRCLVRWEIGEQNRAPVMPTTRWKALPDDG